MSWIFKNGSKDKDNALLQPQKLVHPSHETLTQDSALHIPLEATDLRWDLSYSSSTETQTFYIHLDENALLFFQIAYATLGLSPLCKATVHYYKKDTFDIYSSDSCGSSSWVLSNDRKSVKMPFGSVSYVSEGPFGGFEVVYKDSKKGFQVEMQFQNVAQPFKVGDGMTYFGSDRKSGVPFIRHFFHPYGSAKGVITTNEHKRQSFSGSGVFVHALQIKPTAIASHWNFVNFQSQDLGLLMLQIKTPKEFNHESVNHGVIVYKGEIYHVSANNLVEYLNTECEKSTGYFIPKQILYSWRGKGDSGKDIIAEMRPYTNNMSNRIDMLGELPYLLRKVLQAVVAKPFIYQWFDECQASIVLGDKRMDINGSLFHEAVFMRDE